ncbi:MAG: SMC-Scp complex subunit ScpB [Acidobacteria bacterium]|nr:SMC-Scp complex subunit ScpB [Acidobacteriota bacterium]
MEETAKDHSNSQPPSAQQEAGYKAAIEAIVYVADEPVTPDQIVAVLEGVTRDEVLRALRTLQQDYSHNGRGIEIRELAGGYKMFTKPEHHELVRRFVKSLTPPLKLSMAALETLATIAYRQPVTVPEIQAIRGVQGAGVLKTLLERKLITTAGRKSVLGRPILYKTTREFLIQFGLSNLQDLPSMEEFEELLKASFGDSLPSAGSGSAEHGASSGQSSADSASNTSRESDG